MPTQTFTFRIAAMKTVKTILDSVLKNIKFALYVIMAARILVALYLRVHNGFDTDD